MRRGNIPPPGEKMVALAKRLGNGGAGEDAQECDQDWDRVRERERERERLEIGLGRKTCMHARTR